MLPNDLSFSGESPAVGQLLVCAGAGLVQVGQLHPLPGARAALPARWARLGDGSFRLFFYALSGDCTLPGEAAGSSHKAGGLLFPAASITFQEAPEEVRFPAPHPRTISLWTGMPLTAVRCPSLPAPQDVPTRP